MAYSADYRKAAIAFRQAGHTFREPGEAFKITPRTYYQWIEILKTSGSIKVEIKRTRRGKTGPDAFKKVVEEKPDASPRAFRDVRLFAVLRLPAAGKPWFNI
jgi:hypothetical protein